MDYKPKVRTLASFQDDYGFKTGDEEADAEGSEDSLEESEDGPSDQEDSDARST